MVFSLTALLWLFGIIYVLACAFLILIILMQEGKSGGLSQADSISQSPQALSDTFGAGGAQKGLYNTTAYTATIFFVLALALTILGSQKEQAGGNLNLKAAESGQVEPGQTSATPAATETMPAAPAGESSEAN